MAHLYEADLRDPSLRFVSWITRVKEQLDVAWAQLDSVVERSGFSDADDAPWLLGNQFSQADVTLATAFRFNQFAQPGLSDAARFPHVARHSDRAERRPEFQRWPVDHEL